MKKKSLYEIYAAGIYDDSYHLPNAYYVLALLTGMRKDLEKEETIWFLFHPGSGYKGRPTAATEKRGPK